MWHEHRYMDYVHSKYTCFIKLGQQVFYLECLLFEINNSCIIVTSQNITMQTVVIFLMMISLIMWYYWKENSERNYEPVIFWFLKMNIVTKTSTQTNGLLPSHHCMEHYTVFDKAGRLLLCIIIIKWSIQQACCMAFRCQTNSSPCAAKCCLQQGHFIPLSMLCKLQDCGICDVFQPLIVWCVTLHRPGMVSPFFTALFACVLK